MPTKDELRSILRNNLEATVLRLNSALRAKKLEALRPVLARIGRGKQLPHWFEQLAADATLPNLDGKTVGSVIEMLLVAVLETSTFAGIANMPELRINPAHGVDLPDLEIGVKSPSENFCTSEPFFSAYERILGTDHDALVLLTNYQSAKKSTPLRLQIIQWKWLTKTQIADSRLCAIAKKHRAWLLDENEAWMRRILKFLAFVSQSDWRKASAPLGRRDGAEYIRSSVDRGGSARFLETKSFKAKKRRHAFSRLRALCDRTHRFNISG